MSDTTGYRLSRVEKDLERLAEDVRHLSTPAQYRERQEAINREFRDVKADLEKLETDIGRGLTDLRLKIEQLEKDWMTDIQTTLRGQLEMKRANTKWTVTTLISVAALALTIIALVLRT